MTHKLIISILLIFIFGCTHNTIKKRNYYYGNLPFQEFGNDKILYFNTDSTFYYEILQSTLVSATYGKYSISNNEITLYPSPKIKEAESLYYYVDSLKVTLINRNQVLLNQDTLNLYRKKIIEKDVFLRFEIHD